MGSETAARTLERLLPLSMVDRQVQMKMCSLNGHDVEWTFQFIFFQTQSKNVPPGLAAFASVSCWTAQYITSSVYVSSTWQ
jgi:hypothetical protein